MFTKVVMSIVIGVVLAMGLITVWALARASSIADAENEKLWAEMSKKNSDHSNDSPSDNQKETEEGGEST